MMNHFVEPTLHALNLFFPCYQFSSMFRHTTSAIIRESNGPLYTTDHLTAL